MFVVGIVFLAVLLILAGRYLTSDILCIAIFGGFPLLMISMAGVLQLQWFTWAKIFTLCAGMFLLQFGPRRDPQRRVVPFAAYLLLVLNILEAAVYDAVAHRWAGATAAAMLIALTPRWEAVSYVAEKGRAAVAYDLSWPWIVAYTFWNAGFVVSAYPLHASDHLAVLAAPLILCVWSCDRQAWVRQRVVTLSSYAILVVAALDMTNVGWIPALSGVEPLRGPFVLAAWLLIGVDCFYRLRARASHRSASRTINRTFATP